VTRSQVGRVPLHWAFERHPTHRPAAVSQTGRVPVHLSAFVAEHWPHAPDGWHAGVPV